MRYAHLVLFAARDDDGLCLCETARLLFTVFRGRLRSADRERCVVLRGVNGHSRFTSTQVRSVTSRLVVEVVDEDGMARHAVFFHLFRVGFRRVRSIVGEGIFSYVFGVRHVGTNLHLLWDCFRFANLWCLVKIVKERAGHRSTVRGMFAGPGDRVSHALFHFLVSCQVMVRQANRAKREQVVTITVLIARRFLRSGDRLLLVSRVKNDLRVYFAIFRVSEYVRPFSDVKGRARRLMLVVRVEGRVDVMGPNG